MKYKNIREEELKNKIAQDYFYQFDCSKIIGNVDFCVSMFSGDIAIFEQPSLLWAEAKQGNTDLYEALVQLILTIGKARTFDSHLPPAILGAFDCEKIYFLPYNNVNEVFYQNDFNWNVAPSNHNTKEFKNLYEMVKSSFDKNAVKFDFEKDDKELQLFIRNNIALGKYGQTKIRIDKNNFMIIYNKWLSEVKPSIAVDWYMAKKSGIIDGDFYLADLLAEDNVTIKDKLFVLLQSDHYVLDKKISDAGLFTFSTTSFLDGQTAHNQFWNKYERPPKEEYWDYIVDRRDLLVPQDIRERKGSFYTPQIWVELSQKYLSDLLGDNWQKEYYVWDCCAGTGNLINGLTEKYKIWASTIDKQDVEVIRDRINNGANLLESHVFQFDFLNDDFDKLPQSLQEIINDPAKREKLVIYINPPYAEAGNVRQRTGTGKNKDKVASVHKIKEKYTKDLGKASNELYAQFLMRIYKEIPDCIIANFSKLKHLQGPNFKKFRDVFSAKLKKIFIIPANSFDNVKGKFPIGFQIWDTSIKEKFKAIKADIYYDNVKYFGKKNIINSDDKQSLGCFGKLKELTNKNFIGHFAARNNDFQSQSAVFIDNIMDNYKGGGVHILINNENLIKVSISFAIRHCIKSTWINDRDQFLYPNDQWKKDKEFQNDCLAFTIFYGQNRISGKEGPNHWIPFTEEEVNARDGFKSHFMSLFLAGKIKGKVNENIFKVSEPTADYEAQLQFSYEAKAVFNAGRELWKYYHKLPNCNVNASIYDIREHFQGRGETGKMNNKSFDEMYNKLIDDLRENLDVLARKIQPKVYEYGFLAI